MLVHGLVSGPEIALVSVRRRTGQMLVWRRDYENSLCFLLRSTTGHWQWQCESRWTRAIEPDLGLRLPARHYCTIRAQAFVIWSEVTGLLQAA